MHEAWRLVKTAAIGWWNDRAMSLGAAIAFYTVFSMAPMLFAVIAVAGLVFGHDAAQGAIVAQLGGLVGDKPAAAIQTMIANAGEFGSGGWRTAFGIGTFLVLATGAFVELQTDLDIIWKRTASERSDLWDFVRTRLLSLAMILGIAFLLLVSLWVDAGVTVASDYLGRSFPAFALHAFNFVLGLTIAVLLFAMIFKVLPDVDLTWRDVAIGAVVTGLLFSLGKFLIGFYLGQSNIASSYGAAASIITILLWIYYSALILLFGAEFTKVYAESHGSQKGRARTDPLPRGEGRRKAAG